MHQRRYFGTDGIRDLANVGNLRPDMVLRIGHAIGRVVREAAADDRRPGVVMVRDTRISGPMISGILSGAILAHGVDVWDAGVLPTPAAALLVRRRGLQMAIVVSASHNPMPDNGIKLFGADGRKLSDDTELAIERYIDREASRDVDVTGADLGRFRAFDDGAEEYFQVMTGELFGDLDLTGRKIVLDSANGSGSESAPRILTALGADLVSLNDEPDGLNINADAGVFAVEALSRVVLREKAAFGIALDGDGDRVMMVDDDGAVFDGDHVLAILARDLEPDGPGMVATVMSNMGLRVLAKKLGLTLYETSVGDRYVAAKMAKTGAKIGGEQSGHIIFNTEAGWFGDGLYTALAVIRLALSESAPLSQLGRAMETFPQVLQNVAVNEKPPISEMPRLQEEMRRMQLELGDEGRILVRYSGTESLARVMVEGRDLDTIKKMAKRLTEVITSEIG